MGKKVERLLEEIKNSQEKVTIYSMDGCPYCTQIKERLDKVGVNYSVELMESDDDWEVLKELSGGPQHVPQVMVNDMMISEYEDPKELFGLVLTEVVKRNIVIK